MVQLLVMRHAKSDWGGSSGDDHDRVLAPRGAKAASLMGRFLTESGYTPDLVVTSTAVRARTTVELAAAAGGWTCAISSTRDFYGTGPEVVLDRLRGENGAARVLVAGHEPTWSALVALTTGGGRVRMPTAAVACVEFAANSWSDVQAGSGQLRWLITPKLLDRPFKAVKRC